MSDLNQKQDTTFACDMFALTPEERVLHGEASERLFADVQEVRETSNGYAFRLPQESATLPKIAEFITYERLCCPFFAFNVEVEPQGGAIWLGLSGEEGIKPFVIAELGSHLKEDIATAAGFR